MQSPNSALLLALAMASTTLVACASTRPASTTTTAADVTTPRENAVTTATPKSSSREDEPKGELVCRTKNRLEGTTELFLEWNGDEAKGVLRQIGLSGHVTLQKVQAQRVKGMIIADDINSTDLVVHAATVHERSGRQFIRVGYGRQPWQLCE